MTFYSGDKDKIKGWLQKKINYLVDPKGKDSIDTNLESLVYNFFLRKHVGSYDPNLVKELKSLSFNFLKRDGEAQNWLKFPELWAKSQTPPMTVKQMRGHFNIIENGQEFIEVQINNNKREYFKTSDSPTFNIYVTFERSEENLKKVLYNGLHDLIFYWSVEFVKTNQVIPFGFKFLKEATKYLEDNDHLKFYYYDPKHLPAIEDILTKWLERNKIKTISRPYTYGVDAKYGIDVNKTSWGDMISRMVAKDIQELMEIHKDKLTAEIYYNLIVKRLNKNWYPIEVNRQWSPTHPTYRQWSPIYKKNPSDDIDDMDDINDGKEIILLTQFAPRKWYYTDADYKRILSLIKDQMSEWDRIADIRRFRPDMMDIEELDRQILEDKLIRELEVRYASVGLSSGFSNLAFELDDDLILHQNDDGETWTLLKDTGQVDDDTDNTIYDEIATETSEEWFAKLLELDDSDYPVANNPRVAKKRMIRRHNRAIGYLEPINAKECLIDALTAMVKHTDLDGPFYNRVVGDVGGHKLKLFGLENYDKRAFEVAWKSNQALRAFTRFSGDDIWCDLGSTQNQLRTGYAYKIYITVVLDGTPNSVIDFTKILGIVLKDVFMPYQTLPNVSIGMKFAGEPSIVMNHFDTIVLYSTDETVLDKMYGILVSKIPEWNEKVEHCRILTPEERLRFFLRTTKGADSPSHSDSTGLAKVVKDKKPKDALQLAEIMHDWANKPSKDKMNLYRSWESKPNPRVAKKVIRDSKGRKIPDRYLEGYKGKRLEERIQEIEERRDEYKALLAKYGDESDFPKRALQKLYRRFESDQGVKDKRSNYTKEAQRRGFVGSLEDKAELASDYYGAKVPLSILKTVNARGMAAWASGGHRPGQTSHSWGIARVNSFLVGGKTFFTADADLAKKLSKKLREAIEDERIW